MYKQGAQQFCTPFRLKHRIETTVNGAQILSYVDDTVPLRVCDAVPFYGAELYQTDRPLVRDGLTLTTWFDSNIKATDQVVINDDSNQTYEVISAPQNVNMRGMYMVLKVERFVDT